MRIPLLLSLLIVVLDCCAVVDVDEKVSPLEQETQTKAQETLQPAASVSAHEAADEQGDAEESKKLQGQPEQLKQEMLNEVRVIIGGPTETTLILTQDIRPWLDGAPRTLRDLVIEQLIMLDADTIKIQPTEEDVDRVVLQIQKNNNYTHEQIIEMLKAIDYTMEEFRADLKRKHIVDMMIDYRVRQDKRMAVSEEEVKAWWDAHAENQFRLVTGHVTTKRSADEIERDLFDKTLKESIVWGAPFVVTEAQLSEEKQFIKDADPDTVVFIEPESEGFEVTKLISKGKEPLKAGTKEQNEKRYKDIEQTLRMERFGKVLAEYEQKLLDNAKITFKHDADRIAVMGK